MFAKSGVQWGTLGEWAAAVTGAAVVVYDEVARQALPVVNGHRRLPWLPGRMAAKPNGRARL